MLGFNTRKFGNSGEDLAENYLKKNGYQVLGRNFTIRGGEIDIVAKDQNILVFVEVKARKGSGFGTAIESITPWKLKALQKTALFYIQKTSWGDRPYRFDLLAIDFSGEQAVFELVKNITF